MSPASTGLLAGMALGIAGYFGGFAAFLLVAALGVVGFLAGLWAEGRIDPVEFLRDRRR